LHLSTLVVCDSSAEKRRQIEDLVSGQEDLSLLSSTTRQGARNQIDGQSPQLVWLELDPDPNTGVNLLAALHEAYPNTYFIVSYQKLDADLVKASIKHGAVDYLDAGTWKEQLPEVISRILTKEKTAQEVAAAKDAEIKDRVRKFSATADRMPAYNQSINKMRKTMEGTGSEVEVPLPPWVMPTIIVFFLALMVAVYFFR
jgi:DNA-binding NtrC family response regulator